MPVIERPELARIAFRALDQALLLVAGRLDHRLVSLQDLQTEAFSRWLRGGFTVYRSIIDALPRAAGPDGVGAQHVVDNLWAPTTSAAGWVRVIIATTS